MELLLLDVVAVAVDAIEEVAVDAVEVVGQGTVGEEVLDGLEVVAEVEDEVDEEFLEGLEVTIVEDEVQEALRTFEAGVLGALMQEIQQS